MWAFFRRYRSQCYTGTCILQGGCAIFQGRGNRRVEKAFREIAAKTYVQGTKTHVQCLVKVSSMERLPASETLFHRAEKLQRNGTCPT